MRSTVLHSSAWRALVCAALLGSAVAHVTIKLPAINGVSPKNAGGYVPLDGPYLTNSPFMLNVGHSFPGYNTIGLQCNVPTGWSVTPQEIPGYRLSLSYSSGAAMTAFTYQLNPDQAFPGGFAEPAQHTLQNMKSSFLTFFGLSSPQPGSCNFSDPVMTAHVGGYPNLFFQCAEVTVSNALVLNASTYAGIVQRSFNPATTQLNTLLWWATPANAATLCPLYTNANNQPISPNATFQLDAFNPGALAAQGAACASGGRWPCDANAPFGGAYAVVSEVASAPRIAFLPAGCVGASCVAPFYNTPFPNCPGGVVAAPVATKVWASSPCAVTSNGHPTAFYGPDPTQPTVVGNISGPPPPAPPPLAPGPPPPSAPFAISQKGIVAWLAVITAVFSLGLIVMLCAVLSKLIAVAAPAKESVANGNGDHSFGMSVGTSVTGSAV